MYDKASPGYRGRCTAPLLVDKQTGKIISNESPEILATLYRLELPGATDIDLAPSDLDKEANDLKVLIYNQVRGPLIDLKCCFATALKDGQAVTERFCQLYQCPPIAVRFSPSVHA